MSQVQVGDTHTMTYRVPDNRCVPDVFPESPEFQTVPRVFATAYMVGAMEWALVTHDFSVRYVAEHSRLASPLWVMEVRYECTVSQVDGRTIWWDVKAFDDLGPIGEGRHARAVLDLARFETGVNRRAEQAGVPGLG